MTPATVAQHMMDCLARNDLSVFESHCHPDARFLRAGSDETLDREQMRQSVAAYHEAFADYTLTVHEVIAEGDKVAVYFTSSATQVGAWRGLPATGGRSSYDEVMILSFEGGRVIRTRLLHDSATFSQQLGMTLVPPAAASAAR